MQRATSTPHDSDAVSAPDSIVVNKEIYSDWLLQVALPSIRSEVARLFFTPVHRSSERADRFHELEPRFESFDFLASVFAEPREARGEFAQVLDDRKLLRWSAE